MENLAGSISDQSEEAVEEEDADEPSPFRYQITAYGADYPVDALVKRINSGDIIVPTFDPETQYEDLQGFQRHFIWSRRQSDRFIESLLLGLPVPGIFLVSQTDGKLLVLDGQQRLRTLQSFYGGLIRNEAFELAEVQQQFVGKSYASLDAEERRKLDDSIIHATVVRQDEPSNDQSSVYMVFERLNTGGTALQPQEIRIALYPGPFVRFLRDLNELPSWREIYGAKSIRFKDQEQILRFFALLYNSEQYSSPMKDFLNSFAGANRDFQVQDEDSMRSVFESTTDVVLRSLGPRAFRLKNAINVAVMDSVLVGIAQRILERGTIADTDKVKEKYLQLLDDDEFKTSVESGTTHESNVKSRLNAACQAMSNVD